MAVLSLGAPVDHEVKAAAAAVLSQAFTGQSPPYIWDGRRYRAFTRAVEEAGISYRESERLEHLKAYLIVSPSSQRVVVSTRLDHGERAFVLVHILGHLLLDHGRGKRWYLLAEQWDRTRCGLSAEDEELENHADELARQILDGNFRHSEWFNNAYGQGSCGVQIATRPSGMLEGEVDPARAEVFRWEELPARGYRETLQGFGDRYREYYPRVFAYVYGRIRDVRTAEDITSEVFEKVLSKAPTARNDQTFAAWLFTVARNLLISYCRRQKGFSLGQLAPTELLGGDPADGFLEQADLARLMLQLSRLPQREQDVLALKYDAELTHGEIAKVLGVSESNVRVLLWGALQKLREELSG
jgi:RNA polymerase sigma factor (sigma-70 family)